LFLDEERTFLPLRRVPTGGTYTFFILELAHPGLSWERLGSVREGTSVVTGCIFMSISPGVRTGFIISAAVMIVWTLLAIRSPTLTYHFAPLMAAAITPLWSRRNRRQSLAAASRLGVASFGAVSALGVVLWATDNLRGPTLWESDGSLIEVVIFAAVGALVGVRSASSKRLGLLAKFVAADGAGNKPANEVQ
jgi:hypothetical protein